MRILGSVRRRAGAGRSSVGDTTASRSGSRTTSAPVVSGPQSHFCPEIVRKSTPAAVVWTAPTDWAPSASTGTPVCARSSASGSTAPVVQSTSDVAIRRVRGVTAATIRSGSGSTTTTRAFEAASGPEQAEVLVGRRDDLVPRPKPEPAKHDPAAVGRRSGQGNLLRVGADELGERASSLRPEPHRLLEVRQPAPPRLEIRARARRRAPPPRARRAARTCPRSGTRRSRAPGRAPWQPRK